MDTKAQYKWGTYMKIIDVAKDFSKTPFGRYNSDSEYSAERFRDDLQIPILKSGEDVTVDFSKVSLGVGSSFLEEAFGGMVRKGFDPSFLIQHVTVKDRMSLYNEQVKTFIRKAEKV